MMPQKVYSLAELETMRSEFSSEAILRKVLSPGAAFEAPPDSTHHEGNPSSTRDDNRHELVIQADIIRASIYNAFADYQPIYGVPVRTSDSLLRLRDDWGLPRVIQDAVIDHFLTQRGFNISFSKQSAIGQEESIFTNMPSLDKNGGFFQLQVSLSGMEEIGVDVESLIASAGDALAIVVFKCRFWYYGKFALFFSRRTIEEPHSPLTICLLVSGCPSVLKQRLANADYGREDMKRMARSVERQVPSLRTSPFLWNIFKTAFINRGKKYRSAIPDTTPEEMMAFF
jgi:hypothetical protein